MSKLSEWLNRARVYVDAKGLPEHIRMLTEKDGSLLVTHQSNVCTCMVERAYFDGAQAMMHYLADEFYESGLKLRIGSALDAEEEETSCPTHRLPL